MNSVGTRRRGLRRGATLLPLAVLVAQMLFQLTPVAIAANVPVGSGTGPITMQLNAGMSGPNYVGFESNDTHPNAQNLTAAGATDWRVWGASTDALAGDARKTGGSGIGDLVNINAEPAIGLRALGPIGLGVGTGPSKVPFSFAWTDGTLSTSATAQRAGLQHNNSTSSLVPGYGFKFSVPAPMSTSRLTVWLSAHHGTGRLTATLGSAIENDLGVSGGQNHGGIYTIDFTGTAPGQSLTVSWVLDSAVDPSIYDSDGVLSTEANVVLYAAALSAGPPANFTIGATPGELTVVQGSSAQSTIATTEVTAPGTVGLSAAVSPASTDVTASLSPSSVAAGGSATLTVTASATAAPGPYTVTVTGLEGAISHQAVVMANIVPSTGAPILFRAVPDSSTSVQVAGLVHGTPATTYTVRLWTSSTCPGGVLGGSPTALATTVVPATDARGDAYFGGSIPIAAALSTYIAAQVVPPGAGSPIGPCIVVSPDNDSWVRALPLTGASPLASSGYVDAAGRGRWFKFAIQPGSRVTVNLSNLPADYDLFLFKDIAQAYTTLTDTASLTKLSAEFAPSAFSPSAFSPSAFSPSAFSPSAFSPSAFSPSAFSPSVFSPSAFSPSAFSPSAFSPSAFSPSAFSPSAFSPSAFSPSAFSPSAFSPSAFSAEAFSSAQTRSLIGVSAGGGTTDEALVGDTWTNTGNFYVLVGGKNGASSLAQPFQLSVSITATTCDGVTPLGSPPPAPTGQGLTSLILQDTVRQSGPAADIASLQTRLASLAARSEVKGAVVDLAGSAYSQIKLLNDQADLNPACVYAKNLVAAAIKDLVTSYRVANPGLKYIVLVGGDKAIPFFRYPDQSLLAPESDYVPPVDPTSASEASLRANYILGQDEYGAATSISQGAISFPVPDLAVGRLVETAAEASGVIDAYLTTAAGITATPTSSLVTGYDFLEDAANSVQADLSAGIGQIGDSLISPNNIAPTAGWTATQLKAKLLGARHDLIFLAGHFSANNALAADFSTTINATDLTASSVDLSNSIVFSNGCHAGYNLVDGDALANVTQTLDWAQAFAQKRATLISGTGYQYGDTDFLEYSERIYAEFAHQLRVGPNADGSGAVSVGQALMRAKQLYLARTPDVRGLHQKALLESALFGLPMLSVNMPSGRIPPSSTSSIVGATTGFLADPGSSLGLQSADATINPTSTPHTVALATLDDSGAAIGSTTATYYSGRDGVVTNPGEPALPLQSEDVTVGGGQVLRGVGFRGGVFTDSTVVPLTGAPNTEIRGVHSAFSSTAFFPMRPWTLNYYDALGSTGGATRLLVTPAQHRVATIGDVNATLRLYSQLGLRLFYSSYTGAAAQSAAPTISGVTGVIDGSTINFQAQVVGNPAAGIQQAWITYTGTSSTASDTWQSIDLVQDPNDSTLWTASLTLPSAAVAANVRFMVQAVNGVGLVSLDDNLGGYYAAQGPSSVAPAATTLVLDAAPNTGVYGSAAAVGATLTNGAGALAGQAVTFTIGGTTRVATTDSAGYATASLPLTSVPGSYSLTAGFGGTATLSPSSAAHAFLINKLPTNLALTPATSTVLLGAGSGVTATLTDANGAAMPYRTIFFVLGGPVPRTTTAITDFAGRASLGAMPATVGVYTVAACFGPITACSSLTVPDSTYLPSGASASITVAWPFGGFYSPVDNTLVNLANAGSAIPVKFSLGGDRGLGILSGIPVVARYTCTSALTDVIESTDTASTSGLKYDAATDVYSYVWKTAKTYAGNCYQLRLALVDGTTHVANFKFK